MSELYAAALKRLHNDIEELLSQLKKVKNDNYMQLYKSLQLQRLTEAEYDLIRCSIKIKDLIDLEENELNGDAL
ncbi:hypothetical protein ACSSWA_01485 [Melioribacter sp. Ez-97]|uniref:hypothetical protein n=1 Tax=unclassified Melioribacter TaxID=2627329 RepID=UPI003ED8E59F